MYTTLLCSMGTVRCRIRCNSVLENKKHADGGLDDPTLPYKVGSPTSFIHSSLSFFLAKGRNLALFEYFDNNGCWSSVLCPGLRGVE